ETAPIRQREGSALDRYCLCESYARATERAALAGARWLGRADQEGAERDSAEAMRSALEHLPIDGHVVIGAGADEDETLARGQRVGAGGEQVDLALDPLEGRGVVARGGGGAMSMIAVGEPGSLQTLPDMYMRKLAVGPRARAAIDLRRPVAENIRGIGIAGTRQAGMAAAALRCLGGELQAQLWPTTRTEIEEAREYGIEDLEKIFTIDDLSPGEVIVAATGVSNGDLLRGVRFLADSARTHSLVMCTRCNWVRFVDGIHFFARERREEVRLLS